jgi:hypothetical protein
MPDAKQPTIKTKIHYYYLNTSDAAQAEEYKALCAMLSDGRHWMNCWASREEYGKGPHNAVEDIELETDFLFSNQWNSTTSRVFDWYEPIYQNRHIKSGHWLEITDEMRAIRSNTLVCGYCGKHWRHASFSHHFLFCDACLDSPYLKESDLHLLRLLPVSLFRPKREPLTDAERTELLPKYIARQTTGRDSRAVLRRVKAREDAGAKYNKARATAEAEYKGMIWLLDHNVNIDNCLFYSHTGKFSFGWRSPVSAEVKSALLNILCEFPYPYEIKATEGK